MDDVGERIMVKISLVVLVGLCIVLTVCGCAAADNANEKEYCMTFDSFSKADADCSYWDSTVDDSVIGYKVCFGFSSSYTALDGGHSIGSGGGEYCDEDVGISFIPSASIDTVGQLPGARFKVCVGDRSLASLTRVPDNAQNVTTDSFSIQNLSSTYTTYDYQSGTRSDELGNMYYTYRPFGMLNIIIKRPIYLIVSTSDMSPEDCIALFKSIRITEIHGTSPKYWLEAGNKLFDSASYEDAIAAYSNVETAPYSTDEIAYEVRDKTGIALYRLGRYGDAISWFASGKPDSSEAWYSYAMALNATGRVQQAEYALDQGSKKIGDEVSLVAVASQGAGKGLELAGTDWNVDLLIRGLAHERSMVRIWSAFALGELKCKNAIDPLIKALNDTNADVREKAAQALGKIGDNKAVKPLNFALADQDNNVKQAAMVALGKIRATSANSAYSDDQTLDMLIQALNNTDLASYSIRESAIKSLGEIGDPRAIGPLLHVLDDENYKGLVNVIGTALGMIGEPAIDPLIEIMKGEYRDETPNEMIDFYKMSAAKIALSMIGEPAVGHLKEVLIDNNSTRRGKEYASYALKEIAGPQDEGKS